MGLVCSMNDPILLMDSNYLCHRAYHAMGDLSYGARGTGAVFGFLRDIVTLQDELKSTRCVFAFDPGAPGLRHAQLPTYKSTRRDRHRDETDEEKEGRADFHRQIEKLRQEYLPAAGFNNVFMAPGYEADDIIATVAAGMPDSQEVIIVGSDHDLWQCLRPNVWNWNPHTRKGYDAGAFRKQWGLPPKKWADVKALAGCKSDDVTGVPGVGEATAAKWIRGDLGPHTKAAKALGASRGLYNANIGIVRLPFPGCPEFSIRPDTVTEDKWVDLVDSLGMDSLKRTPPRAANAKKGRSRGTKNQGFGLTGP